MHYRRDHAGHHYFFTLVSKQRQPLLTLPENIEIACARHSAAKKPRARLSSMPW